jgi:hypothetical protein
MPFNSLVSRLLIYKFAQHYYLLLQSKVLDPPAFSFHSVDLWSTKDTSSSSILGSDYILTSMSSLHPPTLYTFFHSLGLAMEGMLCVAKRKKPVVNQGY